MQPVDVRLKVPAERSVGRHKRSQRCDSHRHTGLAERVVCARGQAALLIGQGV